MELLTSEQMQAYDRQTIDELGIPGAVLMVNAGRAAVAELVKKYADLAPGPVLVLAGKGNNGGDGYVMALALKALGWQVQTLVLADRAQIAGDARLQLQALDDSGAEPAFVSTETELASRLEACREAALVVDAIFGTGLSSPVRGLAAVAIDWINRFAGPVLAVDIPSGVDASSGRICGVAVKADLTVSFAFAKIGQVVFPGVERVGELKVADIGIPQELAVKRNNPVRLETGATVRELFPLRPLTGHKGTFGHLLVIAGSAGKTGAAVLTAEAAMRVGAGLTTLAAPQPIQPVLAGKLLEVMTEAVGSGDAFLGEGDLPRLQELGRDKQALAIGPGLGTAKTTLDLVCQLVTESNQPLVIDADALNAIATQRHLLKHVQNRQLVLTPHPGEMARLTGLSIGDIEADRIAVARQFALDHRLVLVLKGARTLTALPDGSVYVNSSGNPGMASGGMGDVLTGMIGGLLAQGVAPDMAARLAVFWHGQAGDDLAATMGDCGLLAGDLLRRLPETRLAILKNGGERC
jgi:ADP-dependent NAD(P)H-hydrate dehydratase / NAD(P)H-hydrate epimerase